MICLAIGAGLLAAFAIKRAHRRHHGCGYGYGHGCDGGSGWRGPHGWRGPRGWHGRGGGRWPLHMALSHLDATPAQERAIVAEIGRLEERLATAKLTAKEARGDLAAAIRGPALDDAALGAVLGRVDGATAEARTAVIEALRNVHGLLDDGQRAQLADLLDKGAWRGGAGGGPYRV